jgi:hypothetical protein
MGDFLDGITGSEKTSALGEVRTLVQSIQNPADLERQIRNRMLRESGETGESPAMIFADIVNTTRVDNRMIGNLLGIELEADRMDPERAAELIAGCVNNDFEPLLLVFNELAQQRREILEALMDDDEFAEYNDQKQVLMFTDPGE